VVVVGVFRCEIIAALVEATPPKHLR